MLIWRLAACFACLCASVALSAPVTGEALRESFVRDLHIELLDELRIRRSAARGFGVVADAPLRRGKRLAVMPVASMINEERAVVDRPFLSQGTTRTGIKKSKCTFFFLTLCTLTILRVETLAMLLLYERFVRREKSKWFTYIAALPRHFNTTLYWTEAQLAALRPSPIAKVSQNKKEAEAKELKKSTKRKRRIAIESDYCLGLNLFCFYFFLLHLSFHF